MRQNCLYNKTIHYGIVQTCEYTYSKDRSDQQNYGYDDGDDDDDEEGEFAGYVNGLVHVNVATFVASSISEADKLTP